MGHNQGGIMNQQPGGCNAFVVIDQRPSRREAFPYSLSVNGILVFSILKCFVGSLLFITGIVNVAIVKYDTMIAFGIWCGLTILANGIIGCILKFKQNKCLIGSFLGLSITSLIFDVSMLSFYSVVLDYFVTYFRYYCYYSHYQPWRCDYSEYYSAKNLGIGITSFLIFLGSWELACSIGSVVLSGKAYCKCCNTCDADDSCTCLGCCECSIAPLNVQQARQPHTAPHYNYQNMQMSSFPPHSYASNPNQPMLNTVVQSSEASNMQGSESNPCSGLTSFVINIPSYIFGGTQMSAINVNLQPVPLNQQVPLIAPERNIAQTKPQQIWKHKLFNATKMVLIFTF